MNGLRNCIAICILLALPLANAQTTTATLSGIVTDPTGAAAVGAAVTATETSTGLTRTATANRDGIYNLVLLPAGTYRLSTKLAGFSTVQTNGVVLQVGDHVALDIRLQVGQVKDSVTVTADAGKLQLQTESGERSEVITNRQVRDLALNGRNLLALMGTMPGIVNNGSGLASDVGDYNVNGSRLTMNQMKIDGTSNVRVGSNNYSMVNTNPDAIEEMKVQSSNFDAEYGKAGGAVIQYITRAGTSQFHGGARYFWRNESLNANEFFNNGIGQARPRYRYNDYGYDIGGPVLIPGTRFNKNHDKLFFFWNQEFQPNQTPGGLNSIQVPTALERNGDFSKSRDGNGSAIVVTDPAAGSPFPGNVIPQSRWFQQGQAILNILPQANNTTGGYRYNYTSQFSSAAPYHETILRIDWNLSNRTHVSGRIIRNHFDSHYNTSGTGIANIAYNFPLSTLDLEESPWSQSYTVTHTFSPTLTNEFSLGIAYFDASSADLDGGMLKAKYGISFPMLLNNTGGTATLPSMTFGGISNQTAPTMTLGVLPRKSYNQSTDINDNLMKVRGSHMVKVGVFVQHSLNVSNQSPGNVQGTIGFANNTSNPLNTGDPYANALMGIYASYSQTTNLTNGNYVYNNVEPYIQDTWKVTKRLTLDYGLRVSWITPQVDTKKQANYFVPSLYDPAKAVRLYAPVLVAGQRRAVDPSNAAATLTVQNTLPAAYIGLDVPGSGNLLNGIAQASQGYPAGGFNGRGPQWGPRFGFAWDVTGKGTTLIRGGYGISYDRVQCNIVANNVAMPPTIQTYQLLYGYLRDLSSTSGLASPSNIVAVDPSGKVPNVQSASLSVQRNIGFGTVVDVAYVGSFAHHMVSTTNINSVPYFTTFQPRAQDPSLYTTTSGVVPAAQPGLAASYTKAGFNFDGTKALPVNFLVPYPGWGTINYYGFPASSNYNAMQVSARRRLSSSLTFNVAYTWSRAFGIGSTDFNFPTNPYNARGYNYGLETFDRTHVLAVNYVYNLPGAARFVGNARIAKALLNHWELAGITMFSSGAPYQMTLNINGVNAGQTMLGTYSMTPNLYRVGGAPGPSGGLHVNPNAYYAPGIGDVGPYPNSYLRQPSWWNHDVSLYKNIPMGGDGKRYAQLRLEMYNAFNHTEFSSVNSAVQLTAPNGTIGSGALASLPNVAITNNLRPAGSAAALGQFFGEYNGARAARVIQVAVKIYF